MNDVRVIVKRALCHGVVGLFAQGSEEALGELDRYELHADLTPDERAVLRGESVGLRGYEQECAFELVWLLGLVDELPAFSGDAEAFERADLMMYDALFARFESIEEFVAAAEPRSTEEIEKEMAWLEAAIAKYGSQRPDGGVWIGVISLEAAKARLSALKWAT